jgi:hypothetical protein
MSEKQAILTLFERMLERDEEIKDIREEQKDAIAEFCEENSKFEPKAIKDGYRFFKKLGKDGSSARDEEYQRDKIVELLIGTDVE